MIMHDDIYRTKDGEADYYFSYEMQGDGSWRIYILWQPSYQGRNTDGHTTHRLEDCDRKYICWTDKLWDLRAAMDVSALWADKTQDYIRTGKTF